MEKINLSAANTFCPQPLYLYGTYREDGRADFGLFCWCCYCAADGFKFVACIGEDKLTRDLIRKNGMFSATVVTRDLLPDADWCGCNSGYTVDKNARIESEPGAVLNVPVPRKGQYTLELKVDTTLHPHDNPDSDIYICTIANIRADERLGDKEIPFDERLKMIAPIVTMGGKYYPAGLDTLGAWGELM